ncbi:MAG: hypothetical protein M0Z95_13455 [Actinomycetota bacterium]|nr:hypothetical protein [Actinomycetota bacterium]
MAVAIVLGIPVAAAAAAAAAATPTAATPLAPPAAPVVTWPAQATLIGRDRTGTAVASRPSHVSARSRPASTDLGIGGGGTTTISARSPSQPRASLATQLGEARRTDGPLGQWVAGVLLLIVAVCWVALVAVVVHVRAHLVQSSGHDPTENGHAE